MSEAPKNRFGIQRIFLKDVSFETPNSPEIFAAAFKPQMQVDLNSQAKDLGNNGYEVTLRVTVTAKIDDKAAFICEVSHGALVGIEGFEDAQKDHLLGAYVPNMLFPYVRETIDGLIVKGTFPPVMLAPVDFEKIYQERKAAAAAEKTAETKH